MAKHFYCFSKFCQYFTKVRIVISDDYSSNIVYSIFIYQNKVHTYLSSLNPIASLLQHTK